MTHFVRHTKINFNYEKMEKVMRMFDWRKIQLTKSGTLNVQYVNEQSDTVNIEGANVVHKDLREALRGLIPHLALITEQRECADQDLEGLRKQRDVVIDDAPKTVWQKIKVDTVTFSDNAVTISGCRVLDNGFTVKLSSPKMNFENEDFYAYLDDLDLDLQAVKYEAEQYLTAKKWGVVQQEINFEAAGDPFEGEVKPGDVAGADIKNIVVDVKAPEKKKVTV